MPRVYDRKPRANDDHNPLKNLLNYEDTDAYIQEAGSRVHNGIFSDMATSQAGTMREVFKLKDFFALFTGKEDGDVEDARAAWIDHRNDVRATIDNIVQKLFGWVGTGWSNEDVAQAVEDQASTTAALSAAIQELQNRQTNQNNGGISAFIDFSLRPDGVGPGSDFDVGYTGSGTGYWEVSGGRLRWHAVPDNDRKVLARYNVAETTTDYQMVGVAYGSTPNWFNNSTEGHDFIFGRMNSARTSYIYVDMTKVDYEVGCVVAGAKTVFHSGGLSKKSNTNYWLQCGTSGGPRIFRLIEGSTPIYTHPEVGTTSQLGSGFRGTGGGASAASSWLGTQSPGEVVAFGFSDNLPPTLVGVSSTMQRASTGGVLVADGAHPLPTNFFDTPGPHTDNVVVDLTNGTFKATIEGTYLVEARAKVASGFPNQIQWQLYVNGVAGRLVGNPMMRGVNALGGNVLPNGVHGVGTVYLLPGDVVGLGYYSDGGTVVGTFTGSASENETYFSIALQNRSEA